MDPTEWHEFVAVETVNAAENTITLAPGASHTMQAHISVEGGSDSPRVTSVDFANASSADTLRE